MCKQPAYQTGKIPVHVNCKKNGGLNRYITPDDNPCREGNAYTTSNPFRDDHWNCLYNKNHKHNGHQMQC